MLQAAATGLKPKSPYVLPLSTHADGGGTIEPLASFTTNPAGAAIVDAAGPIRQIVKADAVDQRRYLVILTGTADNPGNPAQVQKYRVSEQLGASAPASAKQARHFL